MSQHVPEDLLQAFVEGELDDQVAAHVAEHLDACPACATRATGLEPLAGAFAAVADPPPPPGLSARILAAAEDPSEPEPERAPLAAVLGGALLVLASGLTLLVIDGPLATLADLGVVLSGAATLGRSLATSASSFQGALTLATGAALAGLVATFQLASPDRLHGPRELFRRIA